MPQRVAWAHIAVHRGAPRVARCRVTYAHKIAKQIRIRGMYHGDAQHNSAPTSCGSYSPSFARCARTVSSSCLQGVPPIVSLNPFAPSMWAQPNRLLSLICLGLVQACAANFTFTYSEATHCEDFQVSWTGTAFSILSSPSADYFASRGHSTFPAHLCSRAYA